ncbi:MAG TPA: hypothetical protein VGM90_29295 [Kofleriaceae bacterium]|jgi:hypothetical protein
MRVAIASIALTLAIAAPAVAEPLPPGSLGLFFGGVAGTGADADSVGLGVVEIGFAAAWQPMSTEQRTNWAIKASISWDQMNDLNPTALGTELRFTQLDLMPGIRFRPGESRAGYFTLRAGGTLLRSNQVIPGHTGRAFAGAVASVGYDWYLWGVLFNLDARYSVMGSGPTMVGLNIGISLTGP